MLEIDIKPDIETLSLVDQVRSITPDMTLRFAKSYLESHTYISSKKVGMDYIFEHYNLTKTSMDYNKIKTIITHKFMHIISLFKREGLITGYNTGVYKRVDKPKLSDISKSVVDTNEVHLVYYQGRFVNPKFYDVE